MISLKGKRFVAFVGCMVSVIGVAIYPIIISPMMNPEPWKQVSEDIRKQANIKQEDIQPGHMKVWSDPFDRPGKPGNK